MAKKNDPGQIALYSGIGLISGLAVSTIQDYILNWWIYKKSYQIYKKGVEAYGKAFELWWEVQSIDITAKNQNWTEEKTQNAVNDLLSDPYYDGFKTTEKVVEAENFYKAECPWFNKPGYFRNLYSYTNYALIIAGLLPLISQMKNKTLAYALYGAGAVGLFNSVRYRFKKFNIYSKIKGTGNPGYKILDSIMKSLDKDLAEGFNTSWNGLILWSIYPVGEGNPEEEAKKD